MHTPFTHARLALAVAVIAYILSFFHRVAPAALAADLQTAFNIGAAQLGNLSAAYFYVYTLLQIPVGVIADRLGPRRLLFWGGLLAGFGALLFALASNFSVAVAARTLVGLGVSTAFIAMLKIIASGFPEQRFATLVGVCMFIGNLGAVFAGAPLAHAAQAFGWRNLFIGVGLISLATALLSQRWAPELSRAAIGTSWRHDLLSVITNRRTWPGFFMNAGLAGALFAFAGLWAVPYFTQARGMERIVAANHVSLYFFGFALGCLTWGRISDLFQRRKAIMLFASGLNVCGWLVWLIAGTLPLHYSMLLCVLMGHSSGGFTLSWAAAKEVNPPLLAGMATAVVNVGVFLGTAILQPLVGWVMELGWDGRMEHGVRIYSAQSYNHGLLLIAIAALLGWIATLFVHETHCRNVTAISAN